MNRFLRFRLRTLLLLLIPMAAGLAFGPKLYRHICWRHHVRLAREAAIETGPDFHWSIDPLRSARKDEYLFLLSDLNRVLDSLFQTVRAEESEQRQQNALQTIRSLLARSGSAEVRQRITRELVVLLGTHPLRPGVEEQLIITLEELVPATGVTAQERQQLLAMVQERSLTPGWAGLLIEIGGQDELLYVLEHSGTHDAAVLSAIHNSSLVRSRWPGLIPY